MCVRARAACVCVCACMCECVVCVWSTELAPVCSGFYYGEVVLNTAIRDCVCTQTSIDSV